MIRLLLGIFVSLTALATLALAETMTLKGNKRWLAVASTKDLNSAIGIARQLQGDNPQVMSSLSGYYAVVLGPYLGTNLDDLKKRNKSIPELPADALLSNGARYMASVWKAAAQSATLVSYEIGKPANLSAGNFSVTLKLEKTKDDQFSTVISGSNKTGEHFNFAVGQNGEFSSTPSESALLKIDAASEMPQLVLTRYTGGAHCCTSTWIVTKPEHAAGWSLIQAETLDGGGYFFEDVDSDGTLELLNADNRFFYAFDSYSASFAPLQISRLQDGKIIDVTENSSMRSRLKQDLAGMEFQTRINPKIWKSNGFLAAWVASKIRLGEGDDAWETVVENYQKDNGFGPQVCTTGGKVEDCAAENLKALPFLNGLASFLKDAGYVPLPDKAEVLTR